MKTKMDKGKIPNFRSEVLLPIEERGDAQRAAGAFPTTHGWCFLPAARLVPVCNGYHQFLFLKYIKQYF